jgi:hypothetical protein
MARITDVEVRRLVSHITGRVTPARLLELEDELRSDFATEFLREPEILEYFDELTSHFSAVQIVWTVLCTSHAHLRIVQHGIQFVHVTNCFEKLVNRYFSENPSVFTGNLSIVSKVPKSKGISTIRANIVDPLGLFEGTVRIITVFPGRGNIEDSSEIWLD